MESIKEEKPETFIDTLQKRTQKIIDEDFLDDVGYEDANMQLDLWLDNQKDKQQGIPLSGLVGKVKEVSGMMPILRKVMAR